MTQKADTMNLSIAKEQLPFAAHSRASILIIGLSVLALLALAFYAVMPANTPALVTTDGGSQFAISPELQLAQRFAEEAAKKAEAAFLAANPELIAASHYSASKSGASFLAANPELMVASRYSGPASKSESSFLAANPELIAAGRYSAPASNVSFLSTNPELMVASRYSGPASNSESSFLATNPELILSRRYAGQGK